MSTHQEYRRWQMEQFDALRSSLDTAPVTEALNPRNLHPGDVITCVKPLEGVGTGHDVDLDKGDDFKVNRVHSNGTLDVSAVDKRKYGDEYFFIQQHFVEPHFAKA